MEDTPEITSPSQLQCVLLPLSRVSCKRALSFLGAASVLFFLLPTCFFAVPNPPGGMVCVDRFSQPLVSMWLRLLGTLYAGAVLNAVFRTKGMGNLRVCVLFLPPGPLQMYRHGGEPTDCVHNVHAQPRWKVGSTPPSPPLERRLLLLLATALHCREGASCSLFWECVDQPPSQTLYITCCFCWPATFNVTET